MCVQLALGLGCSSSFTFQVAPALHYNCRAALVVGLSASVSLPFEEEQGQAISAGTCQFSDALPNDIFWVGFNQFLSFMMGLEWLSLSGSIRWDRYLVATGGGGSRGHPRVAETLILEPIQKYKIPGDQENRILVSYSDTIQLDAVTGGVPIINPTNPGSGTTPTVNPVDSPPAPIGTNPIPTTPPAGMTPPAAMNPPASMIPPATMTPPAATLNPPATTTPTSSGGAWCIASPTASQTALQVALDYACGYGGADCSALQPGGSCYNPNTIRDHASYAFNSYYQKNPVPTSCNFGGTAQLTNTDPKVLKSDLFTIISVHNLNSLHGSGNCHYASSPTTPPGLSPPVNPAPPPPASTTMTPTITSPGGPPTVYGVPEPVGQPSSATSVSCSLLILFSTTGIVGSLLATKHL
ncbi:hypothetical protein SADUNF_Sadunf16G0229700 [Salix dunnii]|uniref:X8 domain-containing protein n=1 Tax=Salix dunnii TaxID=1413687 RepID=A0A835MMI9_9ROSI|nr:hypothetical protein SADUNF_Sadunf16G0229700 [Salix dunnii]